MKKLFLSLFVMTVLFANNELHAQCLSIVTVETLDVNCQGNPFGEATITPMNGLSPYTYVWSSGTITTAGAHTITDLLFGQYTVTITDSNNCEVQETFMIEQSEVIAIVSADVITCANESAILDATASVGSCGLTYEWSDFSGAVIGFSPTIIVSQPGAYICIVTSVCDGCSDMAIVEVLQTEPMLVDLTNLIPPTSCGVCDGGISANVTGGSPPYAFQWQVNGTPADPFPTIDGICAGLVEIAVTDANGCTVFNEIDLECSGFFLETHFESDECDNVCEAFASATPVDGFPPYNWIWSNGATTETVFDLCPGVYSVTVVDNANATQVAEFNIVPTNPLIVEFNSSAASCTAGGVVEIQVIEGSGDYTYLLNGNEIFTTTIENLPPGNDTIQVIDNQSGCTFEEIVVVGSPYDVAITATETDCDINDGTATAIVPNGSSTYTYIWSDGQTDQTATGLAPGGYSVTVTDTANDCQSHENVVIEEMSNCFVTISGYVIDDEANLDCVPDMTSDSVANQLISLDDALYTFTDENGFYSFQTEPGTHTITFESDSQVYDPLCVDPITVTVPNFGDVAEENNFYLDITNINDIQLYMHKTAIRPGFTHFVYPTVYNFGTETVTGSFEMTHDPNQVFISASPSETSYDPATRLITWDYANLNPNENINYQVNFMTPSSVSLGVEITVDGIVSSFAEDDFPDNNSRTCTRIVTGSYDPNDKEVFYPVEGWEPNTYTPGTLEEMTYKIRFQNTGTDTAFTVVVEDELDQLIDLRDVTPGPSSHPYNLTIRDGNVLQFNFINILLPDSTTNEAASHGYVYFNVDLRDDLDLGDEIDNQAAIFFDFNAPIITNEVTTFFNSPVNTDNEVLASTILLQPNPTSSTTTLFYELATSSQVSIDLLDISGKLVQQDLINEQQNAGAHQTIISTDNLQNGTYFVRLQHNNEMVTRKLVIIK